MAAAGLRPVATILLVVNVTVLLINVTLPLINVTLPLVIVGRPTWQNAQVRSSAPYILIVIGLLAAGFTLRPGVTGLSPLLETMTGPLGIGAAFLAVIGMLPPFLYGIAGILTPKLITRLGAVAVLTAAMVLIVIGLAARAAVSSPMVFLALSVVALAGMGIGNVAIPPLVKAYFPTRIGLFSTLHVAALQIGTFLPPILAVPLAAAIGWRGALAGWALVAAVPALLWGWVLVRGHTPDAEASGTEDTDTSAAEGTGASAVEATGASGTEDTDTSGTEGTGASGTASPPGRGRFRLGGLFASRQAWALMLMTGITSFNNFILFTWLPILLTRAGLSASFGGTMLALVTVIPFVLGLVLPSFAARVRTPVLVVLGFSACMAVGWIGLWLAPAGAPVLWTVLLGLGISTFPLALTLISLRSTTAPNAAALSGFVQGLGYLLAALGPLLFGLLIESSAQLWPAYALVLGSVVVKAAVSARACQPGAIA